LPDTVVNAGLQGGQN